MIARNVAELGVGGRPKSMSTEYEHRFPERPGGSGRSSRSARVHNWSYTPCAMPRRIVGA